MTNKKIEVIEARPENSGLIKSALEEMRRNYMALRHPLQVNPYKIIWSFKDDSGDYNADVIFSFGYHITGDYMYTGEIYDGNRYTIGAQKLDNSFILHEPSQWPHTRKFGVESIQDYEKANMRLREKAMKIAEKSVLSELVEFEFATPEDSKRAPTPRCFIFDARNLEEDELKKYNLLLPQKL